MTGALDIRPGDVIDYPWGKDREPDRVTIQDVHVYDNGALSIRYRFTSNPRGIDWSGYVAPADPDVKLVSRGVARVDGLIRSLLPG